ncbi:hypothetical protein HRbin15_01425 [bacterium HR15]|nr:hypothetical protein HRbin15_01425 [bacterium HR15]
MRKAKRVMRSTLILAGAMLYLLACAYLYTRPEVRVLFPRIAPAPVGTATGEAGCQQQQANLNEQTLRQQLKRNWQQVQKQMQKPIQSEVRR